MTFKAQGLTPSGCGVTTHHYASKLLAIFKIAPTSLLFWWIGSSKDVKLEAKINTALLLIFTLLLIFITHCQRMGS
jgi:hypothetical protein